MLALALFLSGGASLRAQISEPTPTPDPHTYSDPGMEFIAPADSVLVGRRTVELKDLTENLQPIAEWVIRPGKEDSIMIGLAMESYEGPPDQWEAQFESQVHNSSQGVLVRGKTPMSLLNGMPANFVEVTSGEGFQATKQFAVVWADGSRGIALSITTRVGEISPDDAKKLLRTVKAVRFPLNQP